MVTDIRAPWADEDEALEPICAAAIARGADPGLVKYLAIDASMGRHVSRHNAEILGESMLAYPTYAEFLLVHGQAFVPPAVPRPKGIRKGTDKQCFANANHVAANHLWTYVEGYGTSYIPCHHAWVVDDDGNVIETTWRAPGVSYLGVPFPQDIVELSMLVTGYYGVMGPHMLMEPYTEESYRARLQAAWENGERWRPVLSF